MNVSRMMGTIQFDRPINTEKHYISPGGYEFVFSGKKVRFDFLDYAGSVDKDSTSLSFDVRNIDEDYSEDMSTLNPTDLISLDNIEEFFVYTGEDYELEDCDKEIYPVQIKELSIEYIDADGNIRNVDYSDTPAVKEYKFDIPHTEAVEVCPYCDNENVYKDYDVIRNGYIATCQHCGKQIFLCDECLHAKDNPSQMCDWRMENGVSTCFRGKCKP